MEEHLIELWESNGFSTQSFLFFMSTYEYRTTVFKHTKLGHHWSFQCPKPRKNGGLLFVPESCATFQTFQVCDIGFAGFYGRSLGNHAFPHWLKQYGLEIAPILEQKSCIWCMMRKQKNWNKKSVDWGYVQSEPQHALAFCRRFFTAWPRTGSNVCETGLKLGWHEMVKSNTSIHLSLDRAISFPSECMGLRMYQDHVSCTVGFLKTHQLDHKFTFLSRCLSHLLFR